MIELICGVFPTSGQAEEALAALAQAGFPRLHLGIAKTIDPVAAARSAAAARQPLRTWVPDERIVSLPGLGDTFVGGTIEGCLASPPPAKTLAAALVCLGIFPLHAAWYEDQVRLGATLVTLATEDGDRAAEIMRQRGAVQVPPADRRAEPPSSADVSAAVEDTETAFPGWEPGGPGYSGLVPQAHEDGVNIPSEPDK
ncbi:MAG TPA: hypothetical protein VFZ25_08970 [Chloroflexota bacterium]|nr:hypothetical protein [Chloroflexota bacterium]